MDIAVQSILLATKLSAPILGVSLAIGLFVGLIQSATQIQEQTLTFVPKIFVIFISVLLMMPFMLGTLETFVRSLADRIIAIQ
jgi:flagellar biosynthetic protein FliQ